MTKISVIFYMLKQRIPNIFLLSIMFSSLIVIFMVGIGIKNIFYDYMRSDYGNIPDLKVKINNLSNNQTDQLINDIKLKFKDSKIDTLTGYEFLDTVSIVDADELLLSNGLSLFFKSIRFNKDIVLLIDGVKHQVKVDKISYTDEFFIELNTPNIDIKDPNNIKFVVEDQAIEYGFCKKISTANRKVRVEAIPCETKADKLFHNLESDQAKSIKLEVDGDVFNAKINDVDSYYKSLILQLPNTKEIKRISLGYKNLEFDSSMIESFELDGDELVINFFQDQTVEKNYKIFLSKMLKKYINYQRMVLKLNLHSFKDDDKEDKEDKQLVYLNELTDLIDLIFAKDMGNLAISSTFLAQDLNNFGILDNFSIKSKTHQYKMNIRSVIEYNPEKMYDKNILIFNHNILNQLSGKEDINNYIDIYSELFTKDANIKILETIIQKYDSSFKIIKQSDIIPSIEPKKFFFDLTISVVAIFILLILFIAMYIVLLQFYANFNSELALFKLYGSKITYQSIINLISFVISAGINYILMVKQEEIINEIMLKYFFINYEISIYDYFISLAILLFYIVAVYFIEQRQIRKLNLIKGQ